MQKNQKPSGDGGKMTVADAEAQLNKERAQYDVAKESYEGLEAKLEEDFKKELPNLLNEEERDALELDGDVAKQYDILFGKRKAFIDDKLEEEKLALDAFATELEEKAEALQALKAEDRFREKYPDADFEAMSAFFQNEMSPAQIAAVKKASIEGEGDDHELFMEQIMNAYKASMVKPEEEEADLPADLSEIPGETGDIDGDIETNEADMAYLRAIGQA